MRLDISDIAADFPDFRVAAVTALDLRIEAERPAALAAYIADAEAQCRARFDGKELSEIPGIAVWRRAYRNFGIKRTSYRSSVERLVKNVLAGRSLPAINAFVDAYNAISLAHVMPIGADDLDRVRGDVAFRYARAGDSFVDMAAEPGADPNDPPKTGEVVYADAGNVLCRRWNWRQDARSLVTPQTRNVIVTVQMNGEGDVAAAAHDLSRLITRYCGGKVRIAFADRNTPGVEI